MEQFGMPAGRYNAVLDRAEVGRSEIKGGWYLTLRATLDRTGKPVYEERALAKGSSDPYAITKSQRDGLRKMAKRFGVLDSGPAEDIVAALRVALVCLYGFCGGDRGAEMDAPRIESE